MSEPPDDHWFTNARFGMFVHWGAYSRKGFEPSWPLVGGHAAFPYGQDVSVAEYYDGWEQFAPPEGAPTQWAQLAKTAGMQYAVLTTKHHDGITLWPSATGERGMQRSAPGRDLVGEFVDATRAAGLRVGLYYSLSDWGHPDYPPFRDDMRPYSMAFRIDDPERWARFREAMLVQLDELLTRYGVIDVLWFDGGWEHAARDWGSDELASFIRKRQPDIVMNDRLPGVGDYRSPEQGVPLDPPDGWWETCMTMTESWGPVAAAEGSYKPARHLLHLLAEAAGRGGNLLLNVSPDGDGVIPAPQRDRLEGIGTWMDRHGEAIIGSRPGKLPAGAFRGPATRRGDHLYLFCLMRPQELVLLREVYGQRITRIRALGTGTDLAFDLQLSAIARIVGGDQPCDVVIEVPDDACDPMATVLEVTGL